MYNTACVCYTSLCSWCRLFNKYTIEEKVSIHHRRQISPCLPPSIPHCTDPWGRGILKGLWKKRENILYFFEVFNGKSNSNSLSGGHTDTKMSTGVPWFFKKCLTMWVHQYTVWYIKTYTRVTYIMVLDVLTYHTDKMVLAQMSWEQGMGTVENSFFHTQQPVGRSGLRIGQGYWNTTMRKKWRLTVTMRAPMNSTQ